MDLQVQVPCLCHRAPHDVAQSQGQKEKGPGTLAFWLGTLMNLRGLSLNLTAQPQVLLQESKRLMPEGMGQRLSDGDSQLSNSGASGGTWTVGVGRGKTQDRPQGSPLPPTKEEGKMASRLGWC